MKKWIFALSLLGSANVALACTAVNITAKDGTVIAGRTMEWALEMKWQLNNLPAGTSYQLTAPPSSNKPAIPMQTKHALVGISSAAIPGAPAFLEGQNSAGLGMSANFLPGFTEYQKVTEQDTHYVSILEFGTMALGSYASVSELKGDLPKYKVWVDSSMQIDGTTPWLHFVFTDKSGDSLIVEFVGGEMRMHENVAKVLTNAPTYDWHLTNLRNYLTLTNFAPPTMRFDGKNVTEIGQGGGLQGLSADYTPPSRFVRAAYLRHFAEVPATAKEGVQLTAHILNNVDIPIGVSSAKSNGKVVSDYTQWVAIKDLTNQKWMFTDYENRTTYVTLDLKKMFESGKPGAWPVTSLPYPTPDITDQIMK